MSPAPGRDDPWGRLVRQPSGRWTVWKYMWIVHRPLIRALERARVHAHGTLLDVGCGSRPFEPLFRGHVTRYLGTDLASSPYVGRARLDACARAEALPFRDGSVDTVLGLSMMTYFTEPLDMLREASRVLPPGGALLLEFEQMVPVHDEPHDYFRFTRFGATHLLRRAGFEPVEFLPIGGLWVKVGLTAIAALNRLNRGPWRPITELPVRALYVVIQLSCTLLDAVFFDPREVVAHLVVARKAGGPPARDR